MEQNQRNSNNPNDRMEQPGNMRNEQGNENLNTASGLREQAERQSDAEGSGRSYDYGSENSTEEDMNQQLGRNSNQQNVSGENSNPTADMGSDSITGMRSTNTRAGTGSGLHTKNNITGSDYDGQAR
jgi:hypothetical protein